MIDDLPNVTKSGTHKTIASAQELKLPVAVDGNCEETSFDYYAFRAKKGQRVSVEVVANRLGSPLDPVVRLLDAAGKELVYCDDDPAVGSDARFSFTAPRTGRYFIELRDVGYQGGSETSRWSERRSRPARGRAQKPKLFSSAATWKAFVRSTCACRTTRRECR